MHRRPALLPHRAFYLLLALVMAAPCWAVPRAGAAEQAGKVVIEENVPVPMRDGTILRANIARPAAPGKYPTLVMRTAYGKRPGKGLGRYAQAGYVAISQDARGRYDSDGVYESLVRYESHDAEDGYDTVEWAAKLPYSNGKVGTFGASYNSFLQWRLAPLQPPSLVCMSAHSIPVRMTDLEGPSGMRPGRRLKWWYGTIGPDLRKRTGIAGPTEKTDATRAWNEGEGDKLLYFLPWLDLPEYVCASETEAVKAWLRTPHLDPWKLDEGCDRITVPNFDVVGWYDHCNGSIELWQKLHNAGITEAARQSQLVIGPWSHSGRGNPKQGRIDFGPDARYDLTAAEISWFDYWLKGEQNGVDELAPVRIFVMGANRWRDEQEWPLSRAVPMELLLDSGGQANTPHGDGRLVSATPERGASDRYQYDPKDPVPTQWTPAFFTVPADQRPLADRQDILVYQTEPLTEAVEITGYPKVELYAASSAPDTDFFARLIDVHPDGTAIDVSHGMIRARFRKGLDQAELVEPGEVVRYEIELRPTSIEFQPGHRIRLDVTSSDFPNYDRNHNTAADQNADATLVVAEQTIYHGAQYPSRVILPRIGAER